MCVCIILYIPYIFPAQKQIYAEKPGPVKWSLIYDLFDIFIILVFCPFLSWVQGKAFRKDRHWVEYTFDWKTFGFQILSTLPSDTFQINKCSCKNSQATWCSSCLLKSEAKAATLHWISPLVHLRDGLLWQAPSLWYLEGLLRTCFLNSIVQWRCPLHAMYMCGYHQRLLDDFDPKTLMGVMFQWGSPPLACCPLQLATHEPLQLTLQSPPSCGEWEKIQASISPLLLAPLEKEGIKDLHTHTQLLRKGKEGKL